MALSIIPKMVGFLIVGSGITSVITMSVIYQKSIIKLSDDDQNNISIYGISKNVVSVINNLSNGNIQKNEYHCQFGNIKFECEITPSQIVDNKHHWNLSQIQNNSHTNISLTQFKTEGHVYKIKINKSVNDWTINNEISVISKQNSENKYAKLKLIFAINSNNQIDKYTKTQYALVETKDSVTSASNLSYTCTTSESEEPKSSDKCVVSKFTNSSDTSNAKKWHEIEFKKPNYTNVQVEKQKYYLIKLNKDVLAQSIKNIKIKASNGSNIDVQKTIIPAIYDELKPNDIFILSKPTT